MSSSTATTSETGFSEATLETFLKSREEPAWLIERRRQAFARYQAFAWPSFRDEEWRRTDIRGLKLDAFAPISAEPSAEAKASLDRAWETLAASYGAEVGIQHVNGVPVARPEVKLPGGAIFMDLNRAAKDHPELLEKFLLTEAVKPSDDIFAALHGAFWTGGTLLYVPKGVRLDAPMFSLSGLANEGTVDFGHILVILEDGAEATLVHETASLNRGKTPGLHVGSIEVIQGTGSKLQLVNIQNWDATTWHFSRERALVGRDATLQWTVGGLGGRVAKVNQEVALVGEGAQAQVNGVVFTTAKQHLAYYTRQDHVAPNTTSDLLYKGGLKDQSRIVWKGMIRVEKDAQKTDAYQKNDNLVLSEDARADSIPGLEIEANDVRCTHGATAGRVDEEMLFYCQARGISEETAIRLIVEGFFSNVNDRIALEPVRETLRQAVAEKLMQGNLAAPKRA